MPGLIVETEKKLQEDDWIVEDDDDMDNSDEGDDAEEPTREQLAEIRMKLSNIEREIVDLRMTVKDNCKQILLMLEALSDKVSEIVPQHLAGLSVSHEPGQPPHPPPWTM